MELYCQLCGHLEGSNIFPCFSWVLPKMWISWHHLPIYLVHHQEVNLHPEFTPVQLCKKTPLRRKIKIFIFEKNSKANFFEAIGFFFIFWYSSSNKFRGILRVIKSTACLKESKGYQCRTKWFPFPKIPESHNWYNRALKFSKDSNEFQVVLMRF